MAKQLNVNLSFTADTSKAKAQLQDLQNQLKSLTVSSAGELGITGDIKNATRAAAELSVHLQNATNVKTGTLDFTKLNQSIKSSGMSLQEYGQTLASMGAKGQQAFMSLAQAVVTSEVPIRRANARLKELGTTLANTARWQISSSILHGFMGAVQSAYGYAQDLNESLNNIRIVTGLNVDQMARFAEQANKTAKALNTTTTAYTNAALIYFQQGDKESTVYEKTNVTTKMANVTGQDATVVSDQLTAIWNNFNKSGQESYEKYADILTALGAATASSTDEIAGGLEKFASVADMIGLSYEYAASALATITATTRQSEDVVGTALKTIFARIQGLSLGETLEDGTDLNKYSEALSKVGISIKDANGEMKTMDTILQEMGAKWQTLGKDQQIALAQTVAGVRQYNQMVSLMDNWDVMETNLGIAGASEGTLQAQSEIYAESWEAAQKRVKASAEAIYDALINDEFFIDMLNSIEKILGFVDHLIDNLGGLKGVLAAVGAILTRVFSDKISQGISNMAYNITMLTEAGRKKVQEEKRAFVADASSTLADMEGGSSTVQTTASTAYSEQLTLQQKMIDNASKMSDTEKKTVQILMDGLKVRGEAAIAQAKELDAAQKIREANSEKLITAAMNKAKANGQDYDSKATFQQLQYVRETVKATQELSTALEGVSSKEQMTADKANVIKGIFANLQNSLADGVIEEADIQRVTQLVQSLETADMSAEDFELTINSIKSALGSIHLGVIDGAADALGASTDDVRSYAESVDRTTTAQKNLNNANKQVKESSAQVAETIDNCKGKQQTWSDILVKSANIAFSAASALQMLGGAFDKLKDPDASGWEKFLTILTTVGMVVPTLISLFSALKTLMSTETVVKLANVAASIAQAAAERDVAKAKGASSAATRQNTKETIKNTASKWADSASSKKQSLKGAWNKGALARDKRFTQMEDGRYSFKGSKQTFSADVAGKKAGADLAKSMGQMAKGAGLIAAGVIVAIGAVKWGIAQYNKQAEAAEKAAEAAQKAADAYRSVSDAYNTFQSNVDNYSNAKNGLEELTKGTIEYKDAVLKANEAAMELINTNEGLQYTVDEDGLININEESMEMIQEQKMQQMQNAQISQQLAAQNAKNKQLISDRTDFARDSLSSQSGIGIAVGNAAAATAAGAGAGALIGTGIGTIVPGAGNVVGGLGGTAIGAIVGAIAGLTTGVVAAINAGSSSDREQAALEKLAQVYDKEGNARFADDASFKQMLAEQGITDTLLVDSLVANRESTLELVSKMAENTSAISSMNKQMINQEFGDKISEQFMKGFVGDEEEAKALADETSQAMAKELEKRSADLYKDEYKDQMFGMSDKDVQKAYAEAMGWDVDKTENLNGNKATYYDKEGNVVAEELSDEVARQFLAQQAALQQLETQIPLYTKAVNELAEAGNALGDGVGVAIASFAGGDGGNLGTLTQEQFNNASAGSLYATKDDEGNVLSFTYNGETIDDEKAKLLGYESAEAFYNSFVSEMNRVEDAWAEVDLDFAKAGLDPKVVEDLSLEAAQKFQKSLEKMNYGSLGEEGSKVFADGIDMITSKVENMNGEIGMGEADVAKFVEGLSDVDWSSWYAMDDVNALLEQMGYDLDLTTAEMQEFINTMREVGGASPVDALEKTWENAALLSDELSKGIAPGSVLDEEKYKALIQQNAELEDSFMQMMDGTYKYVGDDTLDFSNALNLGETLEQTREMSELYKNAKEDASNINFEGLSKMDFVSSEDIKEAKDALKAAQDAEDKAKKDHADGFLGIKITTDEEQKDLDAKAAATSGAKAHSDNLAAQREKDLAAAQEAVDAVMNSEHLKDVAEYNGWTEETLNEMLEGIKNGEDAAMEQMKVFSSEMNKFMAAGDEGLYDVSAAEEKIASTATSIEELDALTEQYSLSAETYGKAITGLFSGAAAEAESLDELANIMQKVKDAGGEVNMDVYHDNVRRLAEEGLNAAGSLSELQNTWSQALATGAELDYNIYADNLLRLAESYSICADEAEAFGIALRSGSDEAIKAAEENLEAAVMLGEAAEEYGLDAKELSIQSKQMAKAYKLTAKEAATMAVQNQRMNKGVVSLHNNWKKWDKELRKTDRTTEDWANAAAEATTAIADLVGASEDLELPEDFFDEGTGNLELLEKAANGDTLAINQLGIAVANAQISMMQFQEGMTDISGNLIDTNQFQTWKDTLSSGLDNLQSQLSSLSVGDDVYAQLGGDDWVNALNQMAVATGMSVQEMNDMLNSMGVQAKVDVVDVEQMMKVPTYTEVVEPTTGIDTNNDGQEDARGYKRYTIPGPSKEVWGTVQVAQVSTEGGDVGAPKIKFTGNGNVSDSAKSGNPSGGGGGGNNPKPNNGKKKRVSDEKERYHEIERSIDKTTTALTRLELAKDRAFGVNKLKAIDAEIAAQKTLYKQYKDLTNEAYNYAKADKEAFANKDAYTIEDSTGKEHTIDASAKGYLGMDVLFNEYGEIDNYDELMQAAVDKYNAAVVEFEKYTDDNEAAKVAFEIEEAKFERFKELMTQWEESETKYIESVAQAEEQLAKIQELNLEKITTKFENQFKVIERELKSLQLTFDLLADDVYKAAEALEFGLIPQFDNIKSSLATTREEVNELNAAFNATNPEDAISEADYYEMLGECADKIEENIRALKDYDDQMREYYGNTLDMAMEEIGKYISQMEHLASVVEHLNSVLELTGESKDYKKMDTLLQASAKLAKDKYLASKSSYEMLKEQKADLEKDLLNAVDDNARKVIQDNLDKVIEQMNEAEDQMLSDAEAYGEKLNEILANSMAKAADEMEKALSNGMGFEELNNSIDRLSSNQDEYLTKTNQIYEANKMMHTLQQDIDKTTNSASKQKLVSFAKEIEALKESNQLSNLELEIAQAKYAMLQAQIALEEAQQAKSTVRLKRDAEGNYGYVYSADDTAVSDAQQQLMDAENDLYNIRLEATNDYGQKKLQAEQDFANALIAIDERAQEDAIYRETQYQADRARIISEYTTLIQSYSNLYAVAQEEDSRVVADAWVNAYGTMISDGETWKTATSDYVSAVNTAFSTWNTDMDFVRKEVGTDLNTLTNRTKDLTDQSGKLRDKIVNEVVPAMDSELTRVRELTTEYANNRTALLNLIEEYKNYLSLLNAKTNTAQVGFDKNTDYSALINEYLNNGGKVGDATYNQLLAQRDAKIEWLKSDAGGNKTEEYWGTSGAATTALYQMLQEGGGTAEQRAWFEKDYMSNDKMIEAFDKINVALDEKIVASLTKVEENVGKVAEAVTGQTEATTTLSETNKEGLDGVATKTETGLEGVTTKTEEGLTGVKDGMGEVKTTLEDALAKNTAALEGNTEALKMSLEILSDTNAMSLEGVSGSLSSGLGMVASAVSSSRYSVTAFDSGGYTGRWGESGKLAMLHEKELVLNATDTENILQSVQILRSLSAALDANARYASYTGNLTPSSVGSTDGTLQQEVHIEASFPGVTDHNEIELALDNLINSASQYANRK